MGIDEIVSLYRTEINYKINKIYNEGPNTLKEPINYVLSGSGKRIRPLLTILSAEACGGSKDYAMPAALAVELLHNFTLVHDDIMDQDLMRHGQETVHHKWNDKVAILTGDAMLSLSLGLLNQCKTSKLDQIKIFVEGLLAVCEGQALDIEFETKKTVLLQEYLNMINLKTGHLIGLASELGALTAGADNNIRYSLRDYGRLVGRAFQIQDDYLEIFSNSNQMGKSLESDILLGKKTYLMISALERNDVLIRNILKIANRDFQECIEKLKTFLINEGIKDKTKIKIDNLLKDADNKINDLSINCKKLKYFSDLIKNRKY